MTLAVTWQSNPPEKLLKVRSCYMEYLTTYLGEYDDYHCRACGNCRTSNFPHIRHSERMLNAATRFLEEELSTISLQETFGESRGLLPFDAVWDVLIDFLFHPQQQAAK